MELASLLGYSRNDGLVCVITQTVRTARGAKRWGSMVGIAWPQGSELHGLSVGRNLLVEVINEDAKDSSSSDT